MRRFTKYHGCGNVFIIVKEEDVKGSDYGELARSWCAEATGIGADGFIVVHETQDNKAPLEMIFYNSDGSRAPMCGNGIRCFANFCYDEKIIEKDSYSVKTLAGVMPVKIIDKSPFTVEINMGKPDFESRKSLIDTDEKDFLKQTVKIGGEKINLSSVFMGTVHTVIWKEDIPLKEFTYKNLEIFGKSVCEAPIFQEETNVNMAEIINRQNVRLTTYERGAGMTAACGTGATATVVIGILEDKLEKEVNVILPYGKLNIIQDETGEMLMQGSSVKIADGQCFI